MFKTRIVRTELAALGTPKTGILWFCVKHYPIQVEKGSLKLFNFHITEFLGAKVTLFCHLAKSLAKNVILQASL